MSARIRWSVAASNVAPTLPPRTTALKTIKGPGLFLTQFAGDTPPFDKMSSIAQWAAGLGYRGVQIPNGDTRLFDLDLAAESYTLPCRGL